ncbi:BTB/POZ domain-containing protein KCTD6-like [Salvelinus namaycush]|uniref:BTB/POZ domain-containing protein KCTD6-like n=1 Tax=Salvelinus namaycush TaxID=8040 RepID=A0A8U0Q9D4_SALNM|nr:BTB/POZ domain-containing protein KCTD6-like [Salvelinus namaycush]
MLVPWFKCPTNQLTASAWIPSYLATEEQMQHRKQMTDPVTLNVGGCLYTTSQATLQRYPDSMLGVHVPRRLPHYTQRSDFYQIEPLMQSLTDTKPLYPLDTF